MRRSIAILFLAWAPLALAGCLTHMPVDRDPQHLHLPWVEGYDAARKVAAEKNRPMLLVMVAGDIREHC